MFGFENANNFLRCLDKNSMLLILKKYGAEIGKDCDIESGLTFHNCQDYTNLKIGDNVHIGKNCFFDLADEIVIESNAVVSMCTNFITHINMKKSELSALYPGKTARVCIGKNSYIGAGVNIIMGVELGEGSFVAAGSVVTKSFGSKSFIAGIPAEFKRAVQ